MRDRGGFGRGGAGSLDRWIAGSLDRWIAGSLDRWIAGSRHLRKYASPDNRFEVVPPIRQNGLRHFPTAVFTPFPSRRLDPTFATGDVATACVFSSHNTHYVN